MQVSLILACAGKGTRAGFEKNKLLVSNGEKTWLETTLNAFKKTGLITQYIITASKEDFESISSLVKDSALVVLGGETRTQSIKNALNYVQGEVVLIHDGARPFVSYELIERCIDTAIKNGSAIPVVPTRDTLLKSDGVIATEYIGKSGLYAVQTPQGFKTKLIKEAYDTAQESFNDDGEVYKNRFGTLNVYQGDFNNVKLTYPQDFENAPCVSVCEKTSSPQYRFGTGFDCHKLVEDRKLILGGVEIPHDKGLLGHSDADVLTHAIMDAILSACAERDIGYHFPDSDMKYKGADSIELLKEVLSIAHGKGYKVESLSASIMAEKPKLLKHVPTITQKVASVCAIPCENVGITATTLEGLGFVGREEGICVHATATLVRI